MGRLVPKIVPGDWQTVARAIARLDAKLNTSASPSFAGVTLTGLTASRLVHTSAAGATVSLADLTAYIAGTENEVDVANDGDGTVTLSLAAGAAGTLDHNELINTHNLTTDINHASITGGHNLTTDINHANITGGHNLTTDIDHDALTNFVANEHINHTSVSIFAGTGLTGGGDISANRTLSLSHLGIESLTDPNAHRLLGWDDTDGAMKFITIGSGLSYNHSTYTLSASGSTIKDADGDTYVTVESGSDNDDIEGYCAGTKTFEIDQAGIHALPQTSSASVYMNVGYALTKTAWTNVNWVGKNWDTRNEFDITINDRFTATNAGKYLVTGVIAFYFDPAPTVGQRYGCAIYKNGIFHLVGELIQIQNTALAYAYSGFAGVVDLAASDYIEFRYYSEATGNIHIFTHMQVHKLS